MFQLLTASLPQATRSTDYTAPFMPRRLAVIDAFWSSYCSTVLVSIAVFSAVCCCTIFLLLRFLIVYLCFRNLMLLGWSLMWTASLTLHVYQWGSWSIRSMRIIEVKFIHQYPHWYSFSVQLKSHDLHLKWLHRETNGDKTFPAFLSSAKYYM